MLSSVLLRTGGAFMVKKKSAKAKSIAGKEAKGALDQAVQDITKEFGEGAIMRLGDDFHVDVDAISTGALSLDLALGVGGVPRGRVIEVYGPESSGKTTLALNIIAQAQKKGGIAAFIDAEHALDPSYARKIGVSLDDLLVSQPDTGEQALEITERLVRSNAVDVVVIDSVAALVPKAEIEGEMGQAHVGLLARLMSQALRKLTGTIHRTRTCVIFINQIRMKIGVMFGSPETTPGGRALKFHASVRIDIRRIGSIKVKEGDEEQIIGNVVRAKVAKNKVAPPFRKAEFEILFNRGISWEGTLLDTAVNMKIVDKAGAWFSYKSTRLGQGRDQARKFLEENQDVTREIEQLVRAAHAESMGLDVGTKDDLVNDEADAIEDAE
jgi:recombination protein RecA